MKDFLTSAPVLALPTNDEDTKFVLDVDASLVVCSAVLRQNQGGQRKVIECASHTFNHAERNYCVTRCKMCSLVFGLKQFRQYLLCRCFTAHINYMALTYFRTASKPIGQTARYLDLVAEYDFDLQY